MSLTWLMGKLDEYNEQKTDEQILRDHRFCGNCWFCMEPKRREEVKLYI